MSRLDDASVELSVGLTCELLSVSIQSMFSFGGFIDVKYILRNSVRFKSLFSLDASGARVVYADR